MTVSVSVRWLTEQRQLGLSVLAGSSGLERRIEWAHSIELADPSPWLRGGELLLTTGLRLPAGDDDEFGRYVDRLNRAGVAAIGFGVGLSHDRVPDAMVAVAAAAGLPLLQVPLPTPFIAIIRAVSERIAEQQYEGVTRAARVQPRMTRAALHGGNRAVLRELATATGGTVLQLGADGDVIAADPAGGAALAASVIDELRLGTDPTGSPVASMSSSGPTGVVTAHRLQVGRHLHGYLALITPMAPSPIDHLLLGHAASLICLEQEKPLRLREAQNRFNEMLLGLLIDGTLTDPQTAEHLRIAGLPVGAGTIALAIGGPDPRGVLTAIDGALQGRDLPCIGAVRDGHAVVVLPAEPPMLTDEVLAAIPGGPLTHPPAGICLAGPALDIAGTLHRAITAARVAGLRGALLVNADSMAGHALVAQPAARAALAELAQERLGPLVDSDRPGDGDLLGTLRAFLEHNGHWEAASTALGIHRHTLHKRVDRIQLLLGVDLDSAHVRAELLLCLSAWSGEGRAPNNGS